MAARSLEQILGELGSIYDPQLANVRQRQALIPQQVAEEEKGLQAKQEQAFGDILGGARRRGLGFSGIPLSEQARYTSTEFLPALARLKQQGREQAMTLEDAILGIQERRNTLGQQLRQQDVDNDYRERVFQADIAERAAARQLAERQARAGGGGGGGSIGISPTLGGGSAQAPQTPQSSQVSTQQQRAYNTFKTLQGMGGLDLATAIKGLRQTAGQGDPISKMAAQLYYQSLGKPIPSNFREFF